MAVTRHSSVTRHPSAPRMRALRRRQRQGIRRLAIDVTKVQLDQLEVRGYLDPDRRGDRADEIEAVEAFTPPRVSTIQSPSEGAARPVGRDCGKWPSIRWPSGAR